MKKKNRIRITGKPYGNQHARRLWKQLGQLKQLPVQEAQEETPPLHPVQKQVTQVSQQRSRKRLMRESSSSMVLFRSSKIRQNSKRNTEKISALIVNSADRTVEVGDLAMCKKWFEDTGVEFDWRRSRRRAQQRKST